MSRDSLLSVIYIHVGKWKADLDIIMKIEFELATK